MHGVGLDGLGTAYSELHRLLCSHSYRDGSIHYLWGKKVSNGFVPSCSFLLCPTHMGDLFRGHNWPRHLSLSALFDIRGERALMAIKGCSSASQCFHVDNNNYYSYHHAIPWASPIFVLQVRSDPVGHNQTATPMFDDGKKKKQRFSSVI